jgi:hypothetical protein
MFFLYLTYWIELICLSGISGSSGDDSSQFRPSSTGGTAFAVEQNVTELQTLSTLPIKKRITVQIRDTSNEDRERQSGIGLQMRETSNEDRERQSDVVEPPRVVGVTKRTRPPEVVAVRKHARIEPPGDSPDTKNYRIKNGANSGSVRKLYNNIKFVIC